MPFLFIEVYNDDGEFTKGNIDITPNMMSKVHCVVIACNSIEKHVYDFTLLKHFNVRNYRRSYNMSRDR